MQEDTPLNIINSLLPENRQIALEKEGSVIKLLNIFNSLGKDKIDHEKLLNDSREWLNLSKDDMESSEILYQNNKVRDSILLLQQSVEKLVKSYFISFNIMTSEQVREIGHKSPMAFIKLIKEKWVELYVDIMSQHYPGLNTDTSKLKKTINKKEQELTMLSKADIIGVINICNNIYDKLEATNEELKQKLTNIIDQVSPLMDKTLTKKFNLFKDNFDIRLVASFMSIYLLATVTFPHIVYTRYPDRKIKPIIYTKELGVVSKAPELFNLIKRAIEPLEKYLELLSNMETNTKT